VLAVEEREQKRIASELQEAATLLIRNVQHAREDVVEHLGELLGTDPAPAGQALGERGET
jgi:hypothetical protein